MKKRIQKIVKLPGRTLIYYNPNEWGTQTVRVIYLQHPRRKGVRE